MTIPAAPDRCANVSRRLDEPLTSTASRVRRWLLVEQPGPWGRRALFESRLDPTVAGALSLRARVADARAVLVRRGVGTGAVAETGPRRWFAVSSEPEAAGIVAGWFSSDQELLDLDVEGALDDAARAAGHAPLFLVCTNGRHDPCCAEFGRPVYRRLVEEVPEALVFECSHIGGDRFAANVVCLPDGTYYGRVESDRSAALVRDHTAGFVDLDFYRGRSIHTAIEQAAEIELRQHLGLAPLEAVAVTGCRRMEDRSRARWLVTMTVRGEHGDGAVATWIAEVERSASSAARNLTCNGRAERPAVHDVRSLHPAS